MAVARGWEGTVRREKGQPGRAHPHSLCASAQMESKCGGDLHVQVSTSVPTTREVLSLVPKGRGRGKKEKEGKRSSKALPLKTTTTPAYRRYVNPPQPGAEGPWRRNTGPLTFGASPPAGCAGSQGAPLSFPRLSCNRQHT